MTREFCHGAGTVAFDDLGNLLPCRDRGGCQNLFICDNNNWSITDTTTVTLQFSREQIAELEALREGTGLPSRAALIGEALALFRKAAVQSLKQGRSLCSFRPDDPDGTVQHIALPWEMTRDAYDLEEPRRPGLDRQPQPAGAGAGRS